MLPEARVWTPEQVRDLIDESRHWPRYECIGGELLVTPAPRPAHQIALAALSRVLDPYVREHGLGLLLASPADIGLTDDALLQPDLFVVPAPLPRPLRQWSEVRSLLLAVEVLSPGSARADRGVKRRYYQRAGVAEYWIVDLDARLVERWRPGDERPEVASERLAWQPDPMRDPLVVDLEELFAAALGDG